MGFYKVQQGDAPYLKELADTYSMSDNYHRAVQGATGANHIMLGTGDAIWYSDGDGNAEVPPNNPQQSGPPFGMSLLVRDCYLGCAATRNVPRSKSPKPLLLQ
jgi:phospholipase C